MWSNQRKNVVSNSGIRFFVRCRTTEIMLGTAPSDPDIHREFIASKAPTLEQQEAEVEAVQMAASITGDEERESWLTVFPVGQFFLNSTDGILYDPKLTDVSNMEGEFKILPFIHAYQVRGSFKESISMLTKASGGRKKAESTTNFAAAGISAYKKAVDGGWFVTTPRIPLYIPETYINAEGRELPTFVNGRLQYLTRPLRCDTAKGPRVCLVSSEFVPEGTEFMFEVHLLNGNDFMSFVETMDLKASVGMLQWRGGGKGTLEWTVCNANGIPYEDLEWDSLSDQEKRTIDFMNDVIDEIAKPIGYVHEGKKKAVASDDEAAPKKRGRKKKEDAEAESGEDKPKKRGRKKKDAEEAPEEDAEG